MVASMLSPAPARRAPAAPGRNPPVWKRREVLLVFLMRLEESMAMLKGVAQYGRTHQSWSVFLDDEARAETDVQWVLSHGWDGVISRHTTPALVQACLDHRLPLVDLNDTPQFAGVAKIRPDNAAVGAIAAEYFLDRGYQHFAFCGFANDGWSRERGAGFAGAVRRGGAKCDILEVESPVEYTPAWNAGQVAAIAAWLRGLPRPVGVLGCHDARARQIIEAAREAGLLVPEEVAVLGVNNDVTRCELTSPPLSSVATNPVQAGYQAAGLLERLMNGETPGSGDVRIGPLGVVTRRSTDMLAIPDRHVAAALAFIREHACAGLSVKEVLPHAAVSRSQLEKKFRQYLGRSPQAEIRRIQVTRIRQLLIETDLPLKKIAELSGFEYMEYMCVVFRRLVGETPGAYRRRMQPGD